MNIIILEGRMCSDPNVKENTAGTKVANFKIAVDRYNSTTKRRDADFINITAFGHRAAFIEKWFKKGDPIQILGTLKTGSYNNKDGKKVYTTEVWVNEANFCLTRKPNGEASGSDSGNGMVQDDDFFTKLANQAAAPDDDFVKIPDDVEDDHLPFN